MEESGGGMAFNDLLFYCHKSIYVKWTYLRFKINKSKENIKKLGDSFDHN